MIFIHDDITYVRVDSITAFAVRGPHTTRIWTDNSHFDLDLSAAEIIDALYAVAD